MIALGKPHGRYLDQKHGDPDKPHRDVQAVRAHQGEEGRQERAAIGACAGGDHPGELADLEAEEGRAQGEDDAEHGGELPRLARLGGLHRQAADEAAGEQARGLQSDVLQVEQVVRRGAARRRRLQHGEGGKQRREQDRVAEEVDVEAKAGDPQLGGGLVSRGRALARGDRDVGHGRRL